jgi:hypothetical protein
MAMGGSSRGSLDLADRPYDQAATPGYLDGQDQGRYLDVNGVDIWYTYYGCEESDLTPVLFLHGGTGNVGFIICSALRLTLV